MDTTPVIETPLDSPLPTDVSSINTADSAPPPNNATPNTPTTAATNPLPAPDPQTLGAEARRRRRRRYGDHKLIPRFGRSHPLLYRFLLLAAQFQTPLTVLTILSTSGYLRRKSAFLSSSSSTGTAPPSTRSNASLSKLGFTSPFGLNLALFLPLKWGWGEGSGLGGGVKWRTLTVGLWWMMMASFWSRHVLVGTSVWWVLNGWEDEGEGDRVEDDLR
jgi:hypothetical protein